MKKIILLLLCSTSITFAQEKHEVKLNALTLIAGSGIDVSYEYLINKESSVGISTAFSTVNDNYYVLPYYRFYFSKNYAKGFFVEGFGALYKENETNFALGISVGGKFTTQKGLVAELFLGIGRRINKPKNNYIIDVPIIGRIGISLGYRF